MKKSYVCIVLLFSVLMLSCSVRNTNQTDKKKSMEIFETYINSDIPVIEAKNYFVKNSYKISKVTSLKINSKDEFENIFGMASYMGNSGKPTEINFEKQFVIAIIGLITNKRTEITVSSLKKNNSDILLNYKIVEGEVLSFEMQPCVILVLDKKYDGSLKASQN